ncbi:MAG: restriction endonuclease subunit S, partial [Candidatus Edwardsbacteria bacterium]
EGYKKTKVGIVPGEWDVKQLKHILDQVERKVPKPQNGYWRLGLRSHAKGTFHEFIDDPNSIAMEELFSVAENDLIVNITFAWEHAIALANRDDEGKLVSHRFPTYVFNEKACPYFYKYYVIQPHFKKMLSDISPGGAGRNRVMSKSSFRKLFAVLPPLPEQEKIAEILSTWDKAIELKEQLIAGKKQQKKWLMQNLLTGKIRLPGFTDEWQRVRLGEICRNVFGGGTPSRNIEHYYTGNIPWVTVKDLDGSKQKYDSSEHISLEAVQQSASKIIPKGNLIISTRMGLGRGFINMVDMAINQDLKGIILNGSVVSTEFVYYNFIELGSDLERIGNGSTVKGIDLQTLLKLPINLPSLPEQKAIADILSTADREIDLHEKQLEELKKQKKALMQLLLTGIVRVSAQEVS